MPRRPRLVPLATMALGPVCRYVELVSVSCHSVLSYPRDLVSSQASTCSGPCNPGYYCLAGSTTPTQYICNTAGSYCPAGSLVPCPAASKALITKSSLRIDFRHFLVQGYTCNGVSNVPTLCPAGVFCPGGTAPGTVLPCFAGYYSSGGASTGYCTASCSPVGACGARVTLCVQTNRH